MTLGIRGVLRRSEISTLSLKSSFVGLKPPVTRSREFYSLPLQRSKILFSREFYSVHFLLVVWGRKKVHVGVMGGRGDPKSGRGLGVQTSMTKGRIPPGVMIKLRTVVR